MAVDLKGAILEVHRQKWRTAIDVTPQDFRRKHFDIEPNRARRAGTVSSLSLFEWLFDSGQTSPGYLIDCAKLPQRPNADVEDGHRTRTVAVNCYQFGRRSRCCEASSSQLTE